jgi:hypothetical protein
MDAASRSQWQKLSYPNVFPKHDGYAPSAPEPVAHCATCEHYQEWHSCEVGDIARPAKAADAACELYDYQAAR